MGALVGNVTECLSELLPEHLAEDWDNTGLLLGSEASEVTKGMTCLTLTEDVAEEAVRENVELIVSHHPIMFRGIKRITDQTSEGRTLLKLSRAGVSVYCPHTRFDSAQAGINQWLAEHLGVISARPLRPLPDRAEQGAGRWGKLKQAMPLSTLLAQVRNVCRTPYVEYVGDAGQEIRSLGVACGAAGEFIREAAALGCDCFLTGEMRFHGALEARGLDVAVILTGHYASERPAVEWLAEMLSERFSEVHWHASRDEFDPLQGAFGESKS